MRPVTAEAFSFRMGVLAIAAVLYAWSLSRGSFDLFGAENFGLVFNSMLDHMLRGGWDVDPDVIGSEAFFHDGRTYAYFGPFPAILRLPLVALPHGLLPDWRSLHVERLSCWMAVMIGIAAQANAIVGTLAMSTSPVKRKLALPLVAACALSGPPMLLSWKGALVYHESILWAWAFAMSFVALALPVVHRPGPSSWRRLCALSLCAGLCLLTRSTTGAGLYLAIGMLLLFGVIRSGRYASSALLPRWFWAPAGILVIFIALTGFVNQGRWGSALVFADLNMQTSLIEKFPDRLSRLQRYDLFDWHRLHTGILYYVLPVWTDQLESLLPLKARLLDMYDAIEQPASSLLLTDPVWCLLSVQGLIAIIRRRAFAGDLLLAGGLSLAPVLMLVAWYLAFRYRAEFAPLLLALSCIGLRDRGPGRFPKLSIRSELLISALCIVQIGGALAVGWFYALQPFGSTPDYAALSFRCAVQPLSCIEQ